MSRISSADRTTLTTMDPRQPNRFEKKKNIQWTTCASRVPQRRAHVGRTTKLSQCHGLRRCDEVRAGVLARWASNGTLNLAGRDKSVFFS
jgi:hypothetical protein